MKQKQTILDQWSITPQQLTEMIESNPSLRGILLGYLAELKLREIWFRSPNIENLKKYDDHDRTKKGDIVLTYRGKDFVIEVKSLQTNTVSRKEGVWTGKVQCDASDRRKVVLPTGEKLETTCLLVGEFDILAVSLFAFDEQWRFAFAKNSDLPRSRYKKYAETQQKYLLATLIPVTWPPEPPFYEDPFILMNQML